MSLSPTPLRGIVLTAMTGLIVTPIVTLQETLIEPLRELQELIGMAIKSTIMG